MKKPHMQLTKIAEFKIEPARWWRIRLNNDGNRWIVNCHDQPVGDIEIELLGEGGETEVLLEPGQFTVLDRFVTQDEAEAWVDYELDDAGELNSTN